MKADFSRLSFDPRKHYAGVLQQQGRVGLDSDWNEWVEMVLHRLSLETRDVIGSCGRPKHAPGFLITVDGSQPPGLLISDGRLYAGGLLAESSSVDQKGTPFSSQTDWPIPPLAQWQGLQATLPTLPAWPGLDLSALANAPNGLHQLVYLEVWLRHVTALNDEAERDEAVAAGAPDWTVRPEVGDRIRERALGGPDTCTRLQTVAQVKLWNYDDPTILTCNDACAALAKARPNSTTGTMQVGIPPTPPVTAPCQEPLQGGYGGAFNRTYRVEIHDQGAAGTATFKWSTENGAFCVRIQGTALAAIPASTDILVTSIGRDQDTQLRANDWVEVSGEETELGVFRNTLSQLVADPVANSDGTWTLQLTGAVILPHAPFLRRWSANAQVIELNQPVALDPGSGLTVNFFDGLGATTGTTFFHPQDFWVWSARTDIRAIEPESLAHIPEPPRGIERSTCCLSLITWAFVQGNFTATAKVDCTPIFPPLTELPTADGGCCCVISVGDGKVSQGDYNSLADAFNALPDTGSRGGIVICLEEGSHQLAAPITLTQNRVILRGCGNNTILHAPEGAFILNQRRQVTFTNLTIESANNSAISTSQCSQITLRESRIRMFHTPGAASDAKLRGTINQPEIVVLPVPALELQGWLMTIERNEIRGAWQRGGISLLAGSGQVTIRENLIHRGGLPGVSFDEADDGTYRVGEDGGSFHSIAIVENIFRDLSAEAILHYVRLTPTSAPAPQATATAPAAAVSGVGKTAKIVRRAAPASSLIVDLSIIGNLITHCGLGAKVDDQGVTPTKQRAFAKADAALEAAGKDVGKAISLILVKRLTMDRNRILENGLNDAEYNAVFIEFVENMLFRQNTVTGNGPKPAAKPASSGAVTILFAYPTSDRPKKSATGAGDYLPALVADDNMIQCPSGIALFVGAFGAVRVTRNILSNTQASEAVDATDYCLAVVNLGQSIDAVPNTPSGDYITSPSPAVPSLLAEEGGFTQISDNQIDSLILNQAICSVLASSLDDLSFTNNQVRAQTSSGFSDSFHNVLSEGNTLRVIGNRFTEPLNLFAQSCFGEGKSMVTGALNQSTHCVTFQGPQPTAAASLNIVSAAWSERCSAYGKQPTTPARAAALEEIARFQATALRKARSLLASQTTPFHKNLVAAIDDLQMTVSRLPQAIADSFILHGRVQNASGKPLSAVNITLSDAQGVLNQKLPPVQTDAQGFYTVTLRSAEFPALKAGDSQIFVSVTGTNTKELAKPSEPVLYQPGKVALLPIVTSSSRQKRSK